MALKLIDPVYSQMPFFQPNQVLTYNHLNDLAGYLYQQERYTRNKLMGTGIVCGLTFSWIASGNNARVLIDEGCAITSAGYLIVFRQPVKNGAQVAYTHKRVFGRLKDMDPFKDVANIASTTVYELITQDEYDSETLAVKSVLANNDKNGMVLVMVFDLQALNVAKCLDESCDDKGKIYDFTPRPLLVPVSVVNNLVDAASSKPYHTEPGRGHKGKESILFQHNYLYLKSMFKDGNLQEVDSLAELADVFKYPCDNSVLTAYQQTIDNLLSKFPWIFETQLNQLKGEVPALNAQTLGNLFVTRMKSVRDGDKAFVQYSYDFMRDVVDAYNELLDAVSDLVGECGGNEHVHPFHVMLGKPETYETLAAYREEKYGELNFKYRHSFVPSPIVCGQYMLYEQTLHLFKRLVRIIAGFGVNPADTTIKVISGKDYEAPIGDRAIPYYYTAASVEGVRRVWNYGLTRRNKLTLMRGYQLPIAQEELLRYDTARGNFYRIEGHIGKTGPVAKNEIDAIRRSYNLPFSVSTVSIQPQTKALTCSFPDLEEEYSYYRDRATGYLKEVLRWLEGVREVLVKVKDSGKFMPYYDSVFSSIKIMRELLEQECLDKFDYNKYKYYYVSVWNVFFEVYYLAQKENIASAIQILNTAINVMNVIFFRPIYRIWYMYKYRMAVLTAGDVSSLKILAEQSPGAEHLAGVRRGETFLMVTDQAQSGKVVADFSLPGVASCDCECQTDLCDGSQRALVSPMQKPIIMVVDYENTSANKLARTQAVYNEETDSFELELDAMGFYKGGSDIVQKVKILDSGEKEYKKLTAMWENETLILSCKTGAISDGAYALYYELRGDFDENKVKGIIYLFVRGKMKVPGGTYTVTQGDSKTYTKYYPYQLETAGKIDMKFDGPVTARTIGKLQYSVFNTPGDNEIGITSENGKPYLKVIRATSPGVENIPVILTMDGASVRSEVVLNVVPKGARMTNESVAGVIFDEKGVPMKDARIVYGDNEVITDAEGKYEMTGLKAGDVITIEKGGYKVANIQAAEGMNTEINLRKDNTVNIPGMESIKLPDFGSLAKGFNAGTINLKNEKKG